MGSLSESLTHGSGNPVRRADAILANNSSIAPKISHRRPQDLCIARGKIDAIRKDCTRLRQWPTSKSAVPTQIKAATPLAKLAAWVRVEGASVPMV